MTVKELIEELSEYPPETIVLVPDPALEWSEASGVGDSQSKKGHILIFPAP